MDIRRLITAVAMSALVLLVFDYFVPKPKPKPAEVSQSQSVQVAQTENTSSLEERRIPIAGPSVVGSVNLRGARLDDLRLTQYRETTVKDSPLVRVLEKATDPEPNYVMIGWRAVAGDGTRLPDADTLWTADGTTLDPAHPLVLNWDNGQGQIFTIRVTLDDRYMFAVTQSVANHGGAAIRVLPDLVVSRDYLPKDTGSFMLHEGPVGVMNGRLEEDDYKQLRNKTNAATGESWNAQGADGWAGITDKYWLTAIAPAHGTVAAASFGYVPTRNGGSYQARMTPQAPIEIAVGGEALSVTHVFAGAKELKLLERYGQDLQITDFYKAVDFGWFGFVTRPMFHLLHWLYQVLGNFGLALLAFTLIIKIVMFPLQTKTVKSGARMRQLAPRVQAIRDRNKNDPVAANQQVMAMYREEGVNMFGGCLPALVQIPVFFCLMKVLNVAIDMRQAPFFGWIRDLSVSDPSNVFNLFGLLPFNPVAVLPLLHLGAWPIMFGLTTFLMQKMTMTNMEPAQAKIMQFMPVIYVYFMVAQPAGLVIYYTWNNLLSAGQQYVIQRRLDRVSAASASKTPVTRSGRKS